MKMDVIAVRDALENHVFVYEGTRYNTGEPCRFEETGWYQWSELADCEHEPVAVEGAGSVEVVHGETGGEGAAEHCEMVFKVTAGDGTVRFFKKEGWYQSFNGTEWDGDFFEVEPALRTITVYNAIKN